MTDDPVTAAAFRRLRAVVKEKMLSLDDVTRSRVRLGFNVGVGEGPWVGHGMRIDRQWDYG